MSRVGKVPIQVPNSVTVEQTGDTIKVQGGKGQLELKMVDGVFLKINEDEGTVVVVPDSEECYAQQGLLRSLLSNAVHGVTEGFEKVLEIQGVGYRAQVSGQKLVLELGFSHPIEYSLPEGIEASVDNKTLTIRGIDKQLVGQVAADIRDFRKPEPYKGKGIRYQDEQVRRKAGKTATAEAGEGGLA